MVFKGKELIDGAKIKNLAAQYNKIIAVENTFYERYGFYPGDGCTGSEPHSPNECTGTKDGILISGQKRSAFWYLLIDVTGILPRIVKRSVFGQEWTFGTAPWVEKQLTG